MPTQADAFIVQVEERLDSSSVGAKAANLGKVMEQGIYVPPGFVVTRQALGLFLEHTGLVKPVQEFLDSSIGRDRTNRREAYTALSHKLLTAPMPHRLIEALTPLAENLFAKSACGLAVRSSSIYEDSATASFAGVYESFLGVNSVKDLWEAIRRCWCSALASTALDYTGKMGIVPKPDAMAVLVQQLIPAQSAGVLFTVDPTTGNPWRFTLESTFGLAQNIIGGAGNTPADKYVFEWYSGRIIERQIADKPTMCMASPSGLKTVVLSDEQRSTPSLSNGMATRIAQRALAIDRLFDCRVDIEWAVAEDDIHILQVRPVTALPAFFPHHLPLQVVDKTWSPPVEFHCSFDHFQRRVTPPLYRDLSIVEQFNRYWPGLSEERINQFPDLEADFNGHRYLAHSVNRPSKTAEQIEAYLVEYEPVMRQVYLDVKHRKCPALVAEADALLLEARSTKKVIEAFLWARDVLWDIFAVTWGPSQTLFGTTYSLLRHFLARHVPGYEVEFLLQGHHAALEPYYPHTQLAEAEKLAQTVDQESMRYAFERMEPEPLIALLLEEYTASPFMAAFADYCRRFGLFTPDWLKVMGAGERHRTAIRLVQGVLRGDVGNVGTSLERATGQRQACVFEVRQYLAAREPAALPRFDRLFDWALFWGPVLNDRGWLGVPNERIRAMWRYLRRGLEQAGLIDNPPDFGYFTVEDLAHIAEMDDIDAGRRILKRCRFEYECYDRLRPPAFLGKSLANAAHEDSSPTATIMQDESSRARDGMPALLIQGRSCVPGQGKGIARKVESLNTLDLLGTEGEGIVLLLTASVQPVAANTPTLFAMMLRIQGMVTVDGPMMSMHHLGQIARECGVPILQVSTADMACIPDGSLLALDGSRGTVVLQR